MTETISAAFPFESKFVDVLGSKIHYVEQGDGDPILFIHGIPTSSYLWRNVIPNVSSKGRCIAVDLVGLGKSDKPDIEYNVFEHIDYIQGFIDALQLKNITLVMHGWGSVIGTTIAMQNPGLVKGVAYFEGHLRIPEEPDMVSLPVSEVLRSINTPDGGYDIIVNTEYYVDRVLPAGVMRELSDEEMQHYRAPFTERGNGRPIWQFLQDIPLGEDESENKVAELIHNYSDKLCQSEMPKLLMYAVPGFITTIDTVTWAKEHIPNLTLADLGDALHYAQESKPNEMAQELIQWLDNI